jgi:predicted esterase
MDKGKSVSLRAEPDVIEPLAKHTATIIFIHGLGDKPEALFEPIEQWRGKGHVDNIKFVLPYAPIIAFTAVSLSTLWVIFDSIWANRNAAIKCIYAGVV